MKLKWPWFLVALLPTSVTVQHLRLTCYRTCVEWTQLVNVLFSPVSAIMGLGYNCRLSESSGWAHDSEVDRTVLSYGQTTAVLIVSMNCQHPQFLIMSERLHLLLFYWVNGSSSEKTELDVSRRNMNVQSKSKINKYPKCLTAHI